MKATDKTGNKSAGSISPTAQKTRQRIFDAAMDCISQNGYEKTTMEGIIAASGVSKGSLYYHFKDKRAIFLELTDSIVQGHRKNLAEISRGQVGPADKISLTIEGLFSQLRTGTSRFIAGMELASLAQRDPDLKDKQVQVNTLYQVFFTTLIKEGMKTGEFPTTDAAKTAFLLYALLDGIFLRSIMEPSYASKAHCRFTLEAVKKILGAGSEVQS